MEKFSVLDGKTVLVTGHNGFKGTWLCKLLLRLGANVVGYSIDPPTNPNLFEISGIKDNIVNIYGDVRDLECLKKVFSEYKPEFVFHLAAQPIVRDSYSNPHNTYEINVMGTVNIMECVRVSPCVKSVVNVTTDKVYKNKEWCWGYREDEPLDGFDPYSNSKSCSELITHSYINSFFFNRDIAVSTARAGNVIGGGDFANDRIIPDCVRSVKDGKIIGVRNPYSIRPYQHVLEPIFAYVLIATEQYKDKGLAGYYNVGPDDYDCVTTGDLVNLFCKYWGASAEWENKSEINSPHEANFLKLDNSLIKSKFNWTPKWHIEECLRLTCNFYKLWVDNKDIEKEMDNEIDMILEGVL